MSAWYCFDIVRKQFVLVTQGLMVKIWIFDPTAFTPMQREQSLVVQGDGPRWNRIQVMTNYFITQYVILLYSKGITATCTCKLLN